jgi:hypothetical protein
MLSQISKDSFLSAFLSNFIVSSVFLIYRLNHGMSIGGALGRFAFAFTVGTLLGWMTIIGIYKFCDKYFIN